MKEENLVKPIVWHLCCRLKRRSKILVHEKVQNKKYQMPDFVIVHSQNPPNWDKYVIEIIELEGSLERAIYNESHGVSQLKKYVGNRKYLGIPNSAYDQSKNAIERRCEVAGHGLLVVYKNGIVEEKSGSDFKTCGLGEYPHALDRWNRLISLKSIKFRWIKDQSILHTWRESEWQDKLKEVCCRSD